MIFHLRRAAIAMHILGTVVKNTYKNNPVKLAQWATASHIEKHAPVPRPPATPVTPPTPPTPPAPNPTPAPATEPT